MILRFWHGTIDITYVCHGETHLHPDDILRWAKGSVLNSDSPTRIDFLREILERMKIHGGRLGAINQF